MPDATYSIIYEAQERTQNYLMTLEGIPTDYVMNDGELIPLFVTFDEERSVTISLKVRRRFKKEKYEWREVMLLFAGPTQGNPYQSCRHFVSGSHQRSVTICQIRLND